MTKVKLFPPLAENAKEFDAPVAKVLLLEDRAQVTRRGTMTIPEGHPPLVVRDISPVVRDVSVRAKCLSQEVIVRDAMVRRAMRVTGTERKENVVEIEKLSKELLKRFARLDRERDRVHSNTGRLLEILGAGLEEIPDDAAWGIGDSDRWKGLFGDLFSRWRALLLRGHQHEHEQRDVMREYDALKARYLLEVQQEHQFVGWFELRTGGATNLSVEIELEYTVPNALWRPMHHAQLQGSALKIQSSAVVWQNTGEDWNDVECSFSTARASLGTEPPKMRADILSAQKKASQVKIEMRETEVQNARGGKAGATNVVELPGVDDGGQVQNLKATSPVTLLSTGRPHIIDYETFTSDAEVSLFCAPEIDPLVHRRVDSKNLSKAPLLAGPVELIEDRGVVGFSETLFVASGEPFTLGFGPDESIRVTRQVESSTRVDEVTKVTHQAHEVKFYFSNISGDTKEIVLRERIPRSELEHVSVVIDDDRTTRSVTPDENGFCEWPLTFEGNSTATMTFAWELRLAPGSQLS